MRKTDRQKREKVSAWLAQPGNHLVTVDDADYPPLLRQIDDHPSYLYVRGDPAVLARPMIAIVGSRDSTAYGREVAFRLGVELAQKGFVVCSGLAAGIDTEAHKAAVKAGCPTVAVLGNGLHDIYPPGNRTLAGQIAAAGPPQGALISELSLDAPPVASHFPSRNRIISGLSLGVCVVEATLRSGSLITARLALQQNREVFSVPGSVNSHRSRGCHDLLRQGAVLVETADDILSHVESLYHGQMDLLAQLRPATGSDAVLPAADSAGHGGSDPHRSVPGEGENSVLACIGEDPVNMDALVTRTGLTVSALSQQVLTLELSGAIVKRGGSWVRRPTCK
ncbi:MAG: DNA-protecting protein DprA [Gammaproteobacteria bacterium]|nr:DNA-protecting protein DprA [Gammaproteobacteria bacterium]